MPPDSIPCLLFLAADEVFGDAERLQNVSFQPQIKGYAFLPYYAFDNNYQEAREELSRNNIHVISGDNIQVSPEMASKEFILLDGALWRHSPERNAQPGRPPTFVYIWKKSGKTATFADLRPVTGMRMLRVYEYHELLSLKNNIIDPKSVYLDNEYYDNTGYFDGSLDAFKQLVRQTGNIKYGLFREPLLNFVVGKNKRDFLWVLLDNGIGLPDDWSFVLERAVTMKNTRNNTLFVQALLNHLCNKKSKFTGSIPLFTLLCTAISKDSWDICEILLQLGPKVSINLLTPDKVDRLLRALVTKKWSQALQLVLALSPVVTDHFNLTSFDLANPWCRKLMEDCGFMPDSVVEDVSPLLCDAIFHNRFEDVQHLMANSNVNKVFKYDDTWFQRGCTARLRDLLRPDEAYRYDCCKMDLGLDVLFSYRGYFTPLHMAAACGGEAVIKLLLELGADVNAEVEKRTPIYDAILTDNWDAVKLLIANGANVQNNPELVNFAVARRRPDIVELLLLNRCTLNMDDSELERLLGIAATNSHVEVMECLYKFGAKVDAKFSIDVCWYIQRRSTGWGSDTLRLAGVLQALLDHDFIVVDFLTAVRIGSLNGRRTDDDEDFFTMFVQHYMKLKSAELLSDDEKVPVRADWYQNMTRFQTNCDAEIAMLRAVSIGNSTEVKFFDVLTANIAKLARYARHPDFQETMKTKDYKDRFPIYASFLECQFEKGAHRRELLDRGFEICKILSEKSEKYKFEQFEDFKDEIMKHLSNYDLKVLKYEFEQYAVSTDGN